MLSLLVRRRSHELGHVVEGDVVPLEVSSHRQVHVRRIQLDVDLQTIELANEEQKHDGYVMLAMITPIIFASLPYFPQTTATLCRMCGTIHKQQPATGSYEDTQ